MWKRSIFSVALNSSEFVTEAYRQTLLSQSIGIGIDSLLYYRLLIQKEQTMRLVLN